MATQRSHQANPVTDEPQFKVAVGEDEAVLLDSSALSLKDALQDMQHIDEAERRREKNESHRRFIRHLSLVNAIAGHVAVDGSPPGE